MEIVKNLENTLNIEHEKFKNDSMLAAFEKASLEFDELVKSGLAKRRGYNLMTIEGKHLQQYSVNSNLG